MELHTTVWCARLITFGVHDERGISTDPQRDNLCEDQRLPIPMIVMVSVLVPEGIPCSATYSRITSYISSGWSMRGRVAGATGHKPTPLEATPLFS